MVKKQLYGTDFDNADIASPAKEEAQLEPFSVPPEAMSGLIV